MNLNLSRFLNVLKREQPTQQLESIKVIDDKNRCTYCLSDEDECNLYYTTNLCGCKIYFCKDDMKNHENQIKNKLKCDICNTKVKDFSYKFNISFIYETVINKNIDTYRKIIVVLLLLNCINILPSFILVLLILYTIFAQKYYKRDNDYKNDDIYMFIFLCIIRLTITLYNIYNIYNSDLSLFYTICYEIWLNIHYLLIISIISASFCRQSCIDFYNDICEIFKVPIIKWQKYKNKDD